MNAYQITIIKNQMRPEDQLVCAGNIEVAIKRACGYHLKCEENDLITIRARKVARARTWQQLNTKLKELEIQETGWEERRNVLNRLNYLPPTQPLPF